MSVHSELQAALAGTLSQFRYTSVIKIAASVEHDFGDTFLDCSLGNEFADFFRSLAVAAVPEILFVGRSGNKSDAFDIVDDLRAEVVDRAVDSQSRSCGRSGNQ